MHFHNAKKTPTNECITFWCSSIAYQPLKASLFFPYRTCKVYCYSWMIHDTKQNDAMGKRTVSEEDIEEHPAESLWKQIC